MVSAVVSANEDIRDPGLLCTPLDQEQAQVSIGRKGCTRKGCKNLQPLQPLQFEAVPTYIWLYNVGMMVRCPHTVRHRMYVNTPIARSDQM